MRHAPTIHNCVLVPAPLPAKSPVSDVRIECNSNDIVVSIFTTSAFNGMIYPKGLSKNSSCMSEYSSTTAPVQYRLPLRSCNTMSLEEVSVGLVCFARRGLVLKYTDTRGMF